MADFKNDKTSIVLDLQSEQADVCDGKWMQSRYYCDDGDSVRDFLSFNSVSGINPFEVGVNRRAERKAYRVKFLEIVEALELTRLLRLDFQSLSDGEMRRVLFARALLKYPRKLVLVSPMDGLDIAHRAMFQRVMDMLKNQGVDITVVDDEETLNPLDAVKDDQARHTFDAKEPDLLLLDEPCYNLNARQAKGVVSRIERWLKKRPSVTVVCVAHSASHVPAGFNRVLNLER